ncbi:hypothetical protein OsI_28467 [Oryza sativa Indica Group]|uniref:Uncharacterized protein n=1 Tax=Oryza sativa subsp. indica TaxID=39946 RepID=A2YT13_ORYSI|nr:hypothetical protein OsI_28467 [Oryza sativa Indica Group]
MSSALPWLVYNLAMHPRAVSALREELAPIAARKSQGDDGAAAVIFESQETKHLAYQQAALLESLRLYTGCSADEGWIHGEGDENT